MDRRGLLKGFGAAAAISIAPPVAWARGAGRWLRLESENFIVFSTADEAKSREELVALERFHALLKTLMRARERPSPKLVVYMAGMDRDFEEAYPGMSEGVGGFYSPRIEEVRAVTAVNRKAWEGKQRRNLPRNVRDLDGRAVLFHEYAHHFTFLNKRLSYPMWYTEGFADFVATAEFDGSIATIGKVTENRARWIVLGDWMGIEEFLTFGQTAAQVRSTDVAQLYAQGWLTTHYIFSHPERAAGFDKYIAALQKSDDRIAAFEPAFGISPAAFNDELRAYKNSQIRFWPLPIDVPAEIEIKVTRLSESANDIIMPMSYLRALPSTKDAAGSVAKVRGAAAGYPNDPFAQRSLAEVEIWYGELGNARRILDGLLASADVGAEVHHLSGLCDLRAAVANEDSALFGRAQESFVSAVGIDGARANSMFRFAEAGFLANGQLDDSLIEGLIGAYQLQPQVSPIVLTLGSALVSQGRFHEADIVLGPLIGAVHDEGDEEGDEEENLLAELVAALKERTVVPFKFIGLAQIADDKDE